MPTTKLNMKVALDIGRVLALLNSEVVRKRGYTDRDAVASFVSGLDSVLAPYYQEIVNSFGGHPEYVASPEVTSGEIRKRELKDSTLISLVRTMPWEDNLGRRDDDTTSLEVLLPNTVGLPLLHEGIEKDGLGLRRDNFYDPDFGSARRIFNLTYYNFGYAHQNARPLLFVHSGKQVQELESTIKDIDPDVREDYKNLIEGGWLPIVPVISSDARSGHITEVKLYRAIGGSRLRKGEEIDRPEMIKFVIDTIDPPEQVTSTIIPGIIPGAIMWRDGLFFIDFYKKGDPTHLEPTGFNAVRLPLPQNFALFEQNDPSRGQAPDKLNWIYNQIVREATGAYILSQLAKQC